MSIGPFTVGILCGINMAVFFCWGGGVGCIHMYTHMWFILVILMKVEKIYALKNKTGSNITLIM